MAITATRKDSNMTLNQAYGRHLDDAATPAAKSISVGFAPRKITWTNLTDRISWVWEDGMASGTTLKQAANGDRTLDTGDVAIALTTTAGGTAPVTTKPTFTVTIAAAVIVQNKQYSFEILE